MNPASPLPLDVRLMNWTAGLLLLGCAAALLWALGSWAARLPLFALTRVSVGGELARVDAARLRSQVAPALAGNFFTVDLQRVRRAFEQVPWVKSVQVQRIFPHALQVRVQEQQAAALWGEEGAEALVNPEGEVFHADVSAVEDEALVRLVGPKEQAGPMLAMLRQLVPALAPLDSRVQTLALSAHGSWHVQLDSGAALELGSGEAPLLLARVRRLAATLAQVAHGQQRSLAQLQYADLRYPNGYALRLKGVNTLGGDAPSAPRAAPKNHRG
ncbi:cell division protein FtsQ/DivIB [Comamonas flocculans]|uniref:Cell division protein FtsQ n=1 Tax=Comamonas flocculans TaxID=2597701 RepID=A0A5B8RXA1_9BURK|nr:cell division protein FtsQ/DivIB [Comamonas flocculans]QEA13354.1 FtsQ-type POTRA domain-containing protein [Comamonas flocculans]